MFINFLFKKIIIINEHDRKNNWHKWNEKFANLITWSKLHKIIYWFGNYFVIKQYIHKKCLFIINMSTQKEGVADTLEELWISYNLVEKLKGINVLRKLRVLYMSNNLIKDWVEFARLQELPNLENLLFMGAKIIVCFTFLIH